MVESMSIRVEPLQFGLPRESSRLRGFLLNVGLPSVIAAMAASVLTLASGSGAAPAGWYDSTSAGGRRIASVFETLQAQTNGDRDSASSEIPRVQLASLETDFPTGTAAAASVWQTTGSVPPRDR